MPLEPVEIPLDGIVLPEVRTDRTVDLARAGRTLVSLIRHRYWLPCQQHLGQVRERRADLEALGFGLIAVGFSPADALAPLADHLGWSDPFCADVERSLYGRLGIGRASVAKVFNAGTRAIYQGAAERGDEIHRPVEDLRQLGGDVLVVDGVARLLALPESPDDRTPVDHLVDGARALAHDDGAR